jgi:hypothetical protein
LVRGWVVGLLGIYEPEVEPGWLLWVSGGLYGVWVVLGQSYVEGVPQRFGSRKEAGWGQRRQWERYEEAVHCCGSQKRVLRVGWRLDTNTALPGSGLLELVSVGFGREPAEASAVAAVACGSVAEKAEAVAEAAVAEIGAVVAVHLKVGTESAAAVAAGQVELHNPGVEQEPGKSEAPSEVSCCNHQSVDCSILAVGGQAEPQAG